jgi:hypothetical protein
VDKKIKHLEMIQGVIHRMSTNSFLLKSWSVLLVSALFALAAKEAKPEFAYLAYFPVFTFWALDGYFLWQERQYRALFDHVRTLPEEAVDFSMSTSSVTGGRGSWFGAASSTSLALFHGTVTVTIVVVMVLLMLRH